MDFVWFYAKDFSAWHLGHPFYELDYSIRSVKKNYQGEVRCFVIGDDPELEGVIHLEAPPLVMRDDITQQPRQKDHMNKYQVILDSEVNEEFVLIWDDVFILKPTTEEDIKKTYGRCEVTNPHEYINTRSGGRPYKKLWVDTYEHVLFYRKRKGLKTYDWETHLPRFMEKSKLAWLIDAMYLRDIPKLVTGLYHGYFCPTRDVEGFDDTNDVTHIMEEGFQSDIWAHTPNMDFDKEFDCHFMNIGDNIIVPEFVAKMKEAFG